jgi:hypothetical protein
MLDGREWMDEIPEHAPLDSGGSLAHNSEQMLTTKQRRGRHHDLGQDHA